MSHAPEELFMTKAQYEVFEALNPFFEVVMEGLRGLVDGDHYFDTIAEDAFFEFRYQVPGWPLTIRGRANLQVLIWGRNDDIAPIWMGERYTLAAKQAGDPVRLVSIPDVGHFEIASPLATTWPAVRSEIVALLAKQP
jgi:pimeloyl-ACP methyl ester carboxylesterase